MKIEIRESTDKYQSSSCYVVLIDGRYTGWGYTKYSALRNALRESGIELKENFVSDKNYNPEEGDKPLSKIEEEDWTRPEVLKAKLFL